MAPTVIGSWASGSGSTEKTGRKEGEEIHGNTRGGLESLRAMFCKNRFARMTHGDNEH